MTRSYKPKILNMTMHTLCKGVKPALRKYALTQKHNYIKQKW
jgi:hypothetical protein